MSDVLIFIYRTLLPVGSFLQVASLTIIFATTLNADLFKDRPRARSAFMASLTILIASNVAGLFDTSNFDGTPYWPLFWGRWGGALVFTTAIFMHWTIFRRALLRGTVFQRFLPESERQ